MVTSTNTGFIQYISAPYALDTNRVVSDNEVADVALNLEQYFEHVKILTTNETQP